MLARINAVGIYAVYPGAYPQAILDDAWKNPLHSTTVLNLIRDEYLGGGR